MDALTNDEKLKLKEFIMTLSAETMVNVVMTYLPVVVTSGQFNPAAFLTYLNARSASLQSRLDGLEAEKQSQETSLTNEKSIIDGLITKLQGP